MWPIICCSIFCSKPLLPRNKVSDKRVRLEETLQEVPAASHQFVCLHYQTVELLIIHEPAGQFCFPCSCRKRRRGKVRKYLRVHFPTTLTLIPTKSIYLWSYIICKILQSLSNLILYIMKNNASTSTFMLHFLTCRVSHDRRRSDGQKESKETRKPHEKQLYQNKILPAVRYYESIRLWQGFW